MRNKHYHYTKDSDLNMWLDGIGVDNVAMVFDVDNKQVDRKKVQWILELLQMEI